MMQSIDAGTFRYVLATGLAVCPQFNRVNGRVTYEVVTPEGKVYGAGTTPEQAIDAALEKAAASVDNLPQVDPA